jgi:hypothetical protein
MPICVYGSHRDKSALILMCDVPCILVMIAVIIPTYAQITSLLHTLAYMFRPFWVIIRAL